MNNKILTTNNCGCSKSNIQSLNPATCPTTEKKVGQTVTLSATPTSGVSSFTIRFQRNNQDIPNGTFTNVLLNETKTLIYTLQTSDVPSVNLSTLTTDSCTPSQQTFTDSCNITVSACTPPICNFSLTYTPNTIKFGNNYIVVQGTWYNVYSISQTDFEPTLTGNTGYIRNDSSTNLDEIKWSNITLNAGSYDIKIVIVSGQYNGMIELLHGNTSIGIKDGYLYGQEYNKIITFSYSPITIVTEDFRLRINGKNANSLGYMIPFSRLEISKIS